MSKRLDRSAASAIGLTGATLMVGLFGAFGGVVSEAGVPAPALDPVRDSFGADFAAGTIDASDMIEIPQAAFSVSTDAELSAQVEAMLQANRTIADAAVARVVPLTQARSHAELAQQAFGAPVQAPLADTPPVAFVELEPLDSLAPARFAELSNVDTALHSVQLATVAPPGGANGRIILAALPVEAPGGFAATGR